jgi:hypothetical protein
LFTTVLGHPGTGGAFVEEGTAWRGSLHAFRYQGVTAYERDFVLEPVGCETPPPVPASLDRPVLRRVELASGAVLELGRPLPPGVDVERRPTGAWTVLAEAAGRFAGADTIIIVRPGLDDAPVGWIELRTVDDLDLQPLLLGLIREFGAPRRREGGGVEWENRTTQFFIRNPRRVVLIDPRIMR